MQFNKIFLSLGLSIFLSSSVLADNIEKVNLDSENLKEIQIPCKHTAMHYATSIEDINYVRKLLERKEFSLYERNYQCQTPIHIAAELGNIVILNLFYKYLGNFNVVNGNKETPLMTAIKNNQHQAILYMITKDSNLEHLNSEGKSVRDYFDIYGDYLTKKIITSEDNKNSLNNFEVRFKNKEKEYQTLLILIKEKENKIKNLVKNNKDSELIKLYQEEINFLKLKISELEKLLNQQELELVELRNLKNIYQADLENDVKNSETKKKDKLETHIPEEEYFKILDKFKSSNENDVNNIADELKLMQILSEPRYKIKKKKED